MSNQILQDIVELKAILAPHWETLAQEARASGPVNLTTNNGKDVVARTLGGADLGRTGTGAGVSYTATTLTDTGASFPASSGGPPAQGGLVGNVVVSGTVYGVVISNTSTVLTVDFWHNATAPNTTGTTPSANATYIVVPAGGPAWYIGLTANVNAPSATDVMLATTAGGTTAAEIWNSGGNLNRKAATWAHTTGTATYTLQFAATANGSDGASNSIQKIGVFQHGIPTTGAQPTSSTSGQLLFTTAVTSPPTLVSGDSITITDTITIS